MIHALVDRSAGNVGIGQLMTTLTHPGPVKLMTLTMTNTNPGPVKLMTPTTQRQFLGL